MTFDGIITKLRNRAEADIAILQNMSDGASRVALGTAAAAMLSVATFPALADVPTMAPDAGLFDDAAIVQKGSVQLFNKASTNIKVRNGYTVRFVMLKALPYGDTPDDFAKELAQDWSLGDSDVLFVASPKLARAGVFVGDKAGERLTKDIAESIANETYAVAAGEEKYGSAVLDVSNRLIPVLAGDADPGPPVVEIREVVQTYKTKAETSNDRTKYVVVVGVILVISFLAPLLQTYWYVKDD